MSIEARANELNRKPAIVPDNVRCETTHYVANFSNTRCDKAGANYRVSGKTATGFARLCKRHAGSLEKQGYTLELVSPIEESSRGAIAL